MPEHSANTSLENYQAENSQCKKPQDSTGKTQQHLPVLNLHLKSTLNLQGPKANKLYKQKKANTTK